MQFSTKSHGKTVYLYLAGIFLSLFMAIVESHAEVFPASPPNMPVGWTQTAGSQGSWHVVTDFVSEGASSLRTDVIGHSSTAAIETVAASNGTVSFDYRTDTESSFDFFYFYINGVQQVSDSGNSNWVSVSYPVQAGDVLKWAYTKDSSVTGGLDAVWIDNVALS